MGRMPNLHPLDYTILALSLIISLGVGIFQAVCRRKVRTVREYLMAGRRLGAVPVTMSLIASYVSTIGLLAVPAEVYYFGFQVILLSGSKVLSGMLAAWLFVPLLHPLGITSAQEYLQMRFKSKCVCLLGTFYSVLLQLVFAALVVYVQAVVLQAVVGLPSLVSIGAIILLATAYTALGGLKAVVWTDAFQLIIMFASVLAVIIWGSVEVGGPSKMWSLNLDWGRVYVSTNFRESFYSGYNLWSMLIGHTLNSLVTIGISQTAVQRICAIPNLAKAQWSVVANSIGVGIFFAISAFMGMVCFAFYALKECDPFADGKISTQVQITPYFITEVLSYPGMPGIFMAGLLCGSLSTVSSCIGSMSAVLWEDVLKGVLADRLTPPHQVTATQVIALCTGGVVAAMTFMVQAIGGSILQIANALYGLSTGPCLGLFVLGALCPWTNWKGAVTGSLVSLVVVCWIYSGQVIMAAHSTPLPTPVSGCYGNTALNDTLVMTTISGSTGDLLTIASTLESGTSWLERWVYPLSFLYFAVISLLICLIIGVVTSLLTGKTDSSDVDKRLLFVFMRRWFGKPEGTANKMNENTSIPLVVGINTDM